MGLCPFFFPSSFCPSFRPSFSFVLFLFFLYLVLSSPLSFFFLFYLFFVFLSVVFSFLSFFVFFLLLCTVIHTDSHYLLLFLSVSYCYFLSFVCLLLYYFTIVIF